MLNSYRANAINMICMLIPEKAPLILYATIAAHHHKHQSQLVVIYQVQKNLQAKTSVDLAHIQHDTRVARHVPRQTSVEGVKLLFKTVPLRRRPVHILRVI